MTPDHPDVPEGTSRADAGGADPADAERIPDEAPRHTPLWALLSRWLLATEAWLRSHGGRRLRLSLWGFWALVGVAGSVLLVGPVINRPITLDDITGSASTATERWIARDFAVDYDFTRLPDGSLTVQVEERIAALFPEDVDESGIQRVLATQYQGHALRPENIEATLDGEPLEPGLSATPEKLTIDLDTPDRLTGDHVFVVRYELRDLAYVTTDDATDQPVDLLQWDVFGPSWPQAITGLDVSVTIPQEVDDRLVRQPRGDLAWTIVGDGDWLEPEPGGQSDEVTYQFTNDQRLPPHAQAWFTLTFDHGTFSMPPPTALYWVQVYGPLAPLAFLGVTLLLALAARAVAWSDARGRPWFVAQYTAPKNVSPRMAAQILKAPRMMELAEALDAIRAGRRAPRKGQRSNGGVSTKTQRDLQVAAARAARRAGRVGDRFRARSRYLAASERRAQVREGFRRNPHGFVQDFFIAAPIALTLVQWGLIRQLSHQSVLAVVWWPVAFVLVSTVIAVLIVSIALLSRPLTRRGALVKQHLRGIHVFAERTALLERATTSDRVLPFAVLTAPRSAAARIAPLIEAEIGEPEASRRWMTADFLGWPRLAVRAAAILVLAAAVVAITVLPDPYPRSSEYAVYEGDLTGTISTKVRSIDIVGELTRSTDDRAQLEVMESFAVDFDDESYSVPQFARQWPAMRDGHNLGLRVLSVTVDGDEVPHRSTQTQDTVVMETRLATALSGQHTVRVHYALDAAATAARAEGTAVDRVRWAALLDGWTSDSTWGRDPVPDPFHIELRVADDLVDAITSAGWIARDSASDNRARDWERSAVRGDGAGGDGLSVHALDLVQDEYGSWPIDLVLADVGANLDFAEGTFSEPSASTLWRSELIVNLPAVLIGLFAALSVAIGVVGMLLARTRHRFITTAGAWRDAVNVLAPAAAASTVSLFFWATIDMEAGHPAFVPLGLATLAAVGVTIACLVLTRRGRLGARSE